MDFTLLQSFDSYVDAHLLQGRLQEEGIHCWLRDENMVVINPMLSNAVGGIKLMVANDQLDEAVTLFNSWQEEKRKQFSCPFCGSNHIEFINTPGKPANWFSAVLTWALGNYAIGVEQAWHCFDCKKDFKDPVELKEISGEEQTFSEVE